MNIDILGDSYEVINPLTKKAQNIQSNYMWYVQNKGLRSVRLAYTRPSKTKQDIYDVWRLKLLAIDCYDVTVLGASSHFFSIGAKHSKGLFYITSTHNYFVPKTHEIYQALRGGAKL